MTPKPWDQQLGEATLDFAGLPTATWRPTPIAPGSVLAERYETMLQAPGWKARAIVAEAARERAEAALRMWTDLKDVPGTEYTAKYGAKCFSDAMDDFDKAARAALDGSAADSDNPSVAMSRHILSKESK